MILIIDGQGGGIGARLTSAVRAALPDREIICIGTNPAATSAMLKAGANRGATGENPVIYNAPRADYILGPFGIILANSMLGEITPKMAEAIASSDAEKILIPTSKCPVIIAGSENISPDEAIPKAVDALTGSISRSTGP